MLSLVVVEAGEELVFGVALGLRGCGQAASPFGGQGDEVAAAIGRVALAGEQAVGLERVQQRDQDARVDLHRLSEFLLAGGTVVVEQPEQLELARGEVDLGVRVAQSAHRVLAEQREQQSGA